MKTYTGELIEGMPYKVGTRIYTWQSSYTVTKHISEVYHDNEWQRYEPMPKRVAVAIERINAILTRTEGESDMSSHLKIELETQESGRIIFEKPHNNIHILHGYTSENVTGFELTKAEAKSLINALEILLEYS